MRDEPWKLAELIGLNAKELRREKRLTLDDVSIAARQVGLKWSDTRVADFEAGRVAPALQTLVAYCSAMALLNCQVRLADLTEGPGSVAITEKLVVPAEQLQAWLSNAIFQRPEGAPVPSAYPRPASEQEREWLARQGARAQVEALQGSGKNYQKAGAAEFRVQRALEFSQYGFAWLSHELWGQTFSEERNARAGPDANPQKRGQVSRKLLAEAKAEVCSGDHQ